MTKIWTMLLINRKILYLKHTLGKLGQSMIIDMFQLPY